MFKLVLVPLTLAV